MDQSKVLQTEIENLLRQHIGLNPESIGSRAVLRAIKKGLRQSELDSLADYLAQLKTSPALLETLVELVVVPETSFFRNRVSYGFLRQWLLNEWKPQMSEARRPLRILSLPCSSGEEPYSIVITLLEEGLALEDFHIDGVDISGVALEKARKGIFSPYAFRRRAYRNDDRYFSLAAPTGNDVEEGTLRELADLNNVAGRRRAVRYVLSDDVREKVVFHQGNVLDQTLLADALPYDIVFCRNMLIYFDKAARDRTFSFLDRILRPNGLLFIGYAETGLIDFERYQAVPYPQTFAFYKRSPSDKFDLEATESAHSISSFQIASGQQKTDSQQIDVQQIDSLSQTSQRYLVTAESEKIKDSQTIQRSRALSNGLPTVLPVIKDINGALTNSQFLGQSDLEVARELADKGSLIQSAELCDRYLANHPSSAEAHLLKGELCLVSGDETLALRCFSRAVYLNPQMHEALTHLLIIQEGKGDMDKADIVRARLQRLEASQTPEMN